MSQAHVLPIQVLMRSAAWTRRWVYTAVESVCSILLRLSTDVARRAAIDTRFLRRAWPKRRRLGNNARVGSAAA